MKFFSRKLLVLIATAICNILFASGIVHGDISDLVIKLIDALVGIYIIIQGIIDAIHGKQA
jgi:hypothetical protein